MPKMREFFSARGVVSILCGWFVGGGTGLLLHFSHHHETWSYVLPTVLAFFATFAFSDALRGILE